MKRESSSKAIAWLEVLRISNVPTVITNVLVGFAIGLRQIGEGDPSFLTLGLVALGLISLYLGGMVLNDVCDANWDAAHRRMRPIPSERVSHSAALVVAVLLLVAGLALSACGGARAGGAALALTVCVLLYNVLHKRTSLASIFMGACRGLVYVTAAFAVAESPDVTALLSIAGALSCYTVLMTLIASVETTGSIGWRQWLLFPMEAVVLVPLFMVGDVSGFGVALALAIASLVWISLSARHVLKKKARIGRAVQGWIAAFCLIDAFYLYLLEWGATITVAFMFFFLTLLLQRRISGT